MGIKSGVNRGLLFFISAFVSSVIANLNITVFQKNSIADASLLLIISALLLIQFLKAKTLLHFNYFEIVCLLLVAFTILKNQLAGTITISSFSYLVFFIILYYGLKTMFTVNNISTPSFILIAATATILFGYLAFAIYHCCFQNQTLTNFFIPNKSIFGILLASQIAFVLPFLFYYNKQKAFSKPASWFFVALISTSFVLLGFTQSRAGYIGLALSLSYMAYQYLPASKLKKPALFILVSGVCLFTAGVFLFKSGSSSGRLLIYKISAGMLKDNWLFGIGQGQFKIQYNQYQSAYFALHNIDSKEALLADNSFYAFNDFFQALIENGVFAFLLLAAILCLLLSQIKKAKTDSGYMHLFTAAVASLICIFCGCFVSYPLQIFPIVVQTILCICIINSFQAEKKTQVQLSETGSKFAKGILLLLSSLLVIYFCFYVNYKGQFNKAIELKKSGFRQKAIEKYTVLSNSYIQEGNMLYLYAQDLYYTNQLTQAREILTKAKKFYCTNEVYKLSAEIENELQNYSQAEADYKKAIYMVPNRMVSRNELLDFYLERKDTTNAILWANSILNMPVKVPSQRTINIQKKVREVLEGQKK